ATTATASRIAAAPENTHRWWRGGAGSCAAPSCGDRPLTCGGRGDTPALPASGDAPALVASGDRPFAGVDPLPACGSLPLVCGDPPLAWRGQSLVSGGTP